MKIALLFQSLEPEDLLEEKFRKVDHNTGNLIYLYALKKMLPVNSVDLHKEDLNMYDSIIHTKFCWLLENADLSGWRSFINNANINHIPVIPIVGAAAANKKTDFRLHPETAKCLAEIAERSVIGVRGYYTAEVLNQYGIKNLQVIGCPSMYLHMKPDFMIERNNKAPKNVVANFRTFWARPNATELAYLLYSADRNFSFVEQTVKAWNPHNHSDNDSQKLSNWMRQKEKIFFDVDEWRNYMKQFDFSMGHRMHGNIIALWEGIPALFLTIDARMQELCEFFRFPHINANEFDASKPIEYYYELADYTEFNKHYSSCFNEFSTFIKKNHLELSGT